MTEGPERSAPGARSARDSGGAAELDLRSHDWRGLIEQLPLAVYIDRLDEWSSNLYTSPQIEPILGYSVAEWTSEQHLLLKVLHPDDRERVMAAHLRSCETGEPFRMEYRMVSRDGRVVWFLDQATVVPDHTGQPGFHHGFLLDITERKRLEQALRDSTEELGRQKRYFESLLEISPVAIVTTDLHDVVTSWNPAAEGLFGYAQEEALGRKIDDLVAASAELRAEAASVTRDALARQRVHAVTKRTHKDGSLIDVELLAAPVILHGEPVGTYAIYHDLRELKRAEERYRALVEGLPLVTYLPFVAGRSFEASILGLVFGVVIAAYFGHMSVGLCGQLVLRRDPSGRSLVRGCAAAQATAIVVYCLFVLAVNGAVPPQSLAHETGTALAPLARAAGPAVHVLGSAFAVLGLGMVSITVSLALHGLTLERLPSASPVVVTLPWRTGRLLFVPRRRRRVDGDLRLGLVYLGLDRGEPRFRLDAERAGRMRRFEATAAAHWDVLGANGLADLGRGDDRLELDVVEAGERSVRLRVTSSMRLGYEGAWDAAGVSLADVLALPDADAQLVGWIARRGEVTLRDVVDGTGWGAAPAGARLAALVERGVVVETRPAGEPRYAARPAARRGGRLAPKIRETLVPGSAEGAPADGGGPPSLGRARRLRTILLGRRGRWTIATTPVAGAFVAGEWMALTGSGSFAGVIGFVGVIVVTLLAGVFPVLLLASSRRKGDRVPAAAARWLGSPVLLGGVYLLFVASVFLHGLVIWDDPFRRLAALLAGAGMVAMTLIMARRGRFAPRVNVELREGEGESGAFAVTAAGREAESDVRLDYPDGERHLLASGGDVPDFPSLRRAVFDGRAAPGDDAAGRELNVWVHRVTAEHESQGIPAQLDVRVGDDTRRFDLELGQERVVVPLTHASWSVAIALRAR